MLRELVRCDIPVERLQVIGRGETDLEAPTDDGVREARNRVGGHLALTGRPSPMRPFAGILALSRLLAPQVGGALAKGASFADGGRAFQQCDDDVAREVWTALAAKNDPRAEFGLGLMDDLGLGGEPAPEEAFGCYLAAAEGGHSLGMLNVAIVLDAGIGVARSAERTVIRCERAAAAGQPRAQYNLGQIFETGSAAPRDPAVAAARSRVSCFHPSDRDLAQAVSLMPPVIGGDADLAASGEAAPLPDEVEIWLTSGVRPSGEAGANTASQARTGEAAVRAGGNG